MRTVRIVMMYEGRQGTVEMLLVQNDQQHEFPVHDVKATSKTDTTRAVG